MYIKFAGFIFLFGLVFLLSPDAATAQKTSKTKPVPLKKPVDLAKSNAELKKSPQNISLSALESAVFEEINVVRTNPQIYIAYLEEYRTFMKDNVLSLPGKTKLATFEGLTAVDDAISDLKKRSKISAYELSTGLTKVARQQVADLQENVALKHYGKDGSDLVSRLMKVGFAGNAVAENISYRADTAREIVLNMIVDDGVKSRSHRKNVFSSTFKLFGIACGTASNQKAVCVAEFADSFKER